MGGYTSPENQAVRAEARCRGVSQAVILVHVCEQMCVPIEKVQGSKRGILEVSDARSVAMFCFRKGLGRSHNEIAAYFGRDQSSVRSALIKVRDSGELRRKAERFMREVNEMRCPEKLSASHMSGSDLVYMDGSPADG